VLRGGGVGVAVFNFDLGVQRSVVCGARDPLCRSSDPCAESHGEEHTAEKWGFQDEEEEARSGVEMFEEGDSPNADKGDADAASSVAGLFFNPYPLACS
jgi:hypothetical protein